MTESNTRLIILRGISGSGKSTVAKQIQQRIPGSIIVSRDDLRTAFYNTEFGPPIDEAFITVIEEAVIVAALREGKSVISDNTNIPPYTVLSKILLAQQCDAECMLQEVIVALHIAKLNNELRREKGGRFVPEHVIEAQAASFYEHRNAVAELVKKYDVK